MGNRLHLLGMFGYLDVRVNRKHQLPKSKGGQILELRRCGLFRKILLEHLGF